MKFIPISKAKLKINDKAFLRFEDGTFGYGALYERKETAEGMQYTFDIGNDAMDQDLLTTSVTHIAIPKFAE